MLNHSYVQIYSTAAPVETTESAVPGIHHSTTVKLCYGAPMPSTPGVPHPLPDPLVDLIAQRFRCLGEPVRIRLLDRLRDGESTVGELQEATGASQQNVSKHLGVLLAAGMVSRTKQGNRACYAITDETVFELCELVCGGLRRQLSELDLVLQGVGE